MTESANPYQQPVAGPGVGGADPGQTMSIIGLILAFVFAPVGLVLSIIGRKRSKGAGFGGGLGLAGIIISIVAIIAWIIGVVSLAAGASALMKQCADLGPGVHNVNGVTVTCGR